MADNNWTGVRRLLEESLTIRPCRRRESNPLCSVLKAPALPLSIYDSPTPRGRVLPDLGLGLDGNRCGSYPHPHPVHTLYCPHPALGVKVSDQETQKPTRGGLVLGSIVRIGIEPTSPCGRRLMRPPSIPSMQA